MDFYSINQGVDPDNDDREIATRRCTVRDRQIGPRCGDFAELLDGRTLRLSHEWSESFQLSKGGSFYLADGGLVSFSGGFAAAVDKAAFGEPVGTRSGYFWFFHHDHHRAHFAVGVGIPCRVYREAATEDGDFDIGRALVE